MSKFTKTTPYRQTTFIFCNFFLQLCPLWRSILKGERGRAWTRLIILISPDVDYAQWETVQCVNLIKCSIKEEKNFNMSTIKLNTRRRRTRYVRRRPCRSDIAHIRLRASPKMTYRLPISAKHRCWVVLGVSSARIGVRICSCCDCPLVCSCCSFRD